jgi:hypothetical protein
MARDHWFVSIEAVREALETNVFAQPGEVTGLPAALGGNAARWSSLAAAAKRKDGFFELLWTKAHFLVLPKPIVTFMKDSGRVSISEDPTRRSATAETICTTVADQGTTSSMHVPGASDALARAGHGLGGAATESLDPFDPEECAVLGTVYHEMTHAWLCLQEYADADLQKLYRDNVGTYEGAAGARGSTFAKEIAFSEAAAAYVEDRVVRWCTALYGLAQVLADPHVLRWKLRTIPEEYDRPRSMYGVVDREAITSPTLPAALRAAIDRKILDGLPLTMPFADTPLADVREAALAAP